jgi:hypothetical protein
MKKIIILSLALIVFLGGAAVYYFYFLPGEEANLNTGEGNLNENANLSLNANINININSSQNANTAVITDEAAIKEICFIFAERYGSYSNTNSGQNMLDLKVWMAEKMKGEADDYIAAEKNKMVVSYLAFFTKVLAQSVSSLTSQTADCQVSTQRTERNEAKETASYTQNLLLKFVKEAGAWRVSQAIWQEKT